MTYHQAMDETTRAWVRAALERNVAPPNQMGCARWLRGVDDLGFGLMWVPDPERVWVSRRAHRMVYELEHGPTRRLVRQTCGDRRCTTLEHLTPATVAGRPTGRHIDQEVVVAIREGHHRGETQRALGIKWGVSPSHVSRIVNGLVR